MKKEAKKSSHKAGILFLRGACLLIILVTIALLHSYLEAREQDPLMAAYKYFPMLEYIFASALIACGGACLITYVERKNQK